MFVTIEPLAHEGGIAYAQRYRLPDVARASFDPEALDGRRGALAPKTESVPANSKQSYRIRPGEHESGIYSQRATAGARYVQVPVTLRNAIVIDGKHFSSQVSGLVTVWNGTRVRPPFCERSIL